MEPKITARDKIEQAEILKNKGNQMFKAKNYRKALSHYHQANLYITGLQEKGSQYFEYSKDNQLSEEQATISRDIKFSIFMNMSQIYIFENKWEKAKDVIKKAAALKQTTKLVYRRALIHLNLREAEEAIKNFNRVLQEDPSIQTKEDVQSKLRACKQIQKQQEKELAEKYKKMFI